MKKYASLMVLLGAAFWASNGVFVNLFEGSGLSPVEKMCLRCFIAVAIETLIIFFYDRRQFIVDIKDLPWFATDVLLFAVGLLLNRTLLAPLGEAGIWELLWPSALMAFGLSSLWDRISLWSIGLTGFGGYYLLVNMHILNHWHGLNWKIILPVLLVLWAISMFADHFREKRTEGFGTANVKREFHSANGEIFYDGVFSSESVVMKDSVFRGGNVDLSFGNYTLDLTACETVEPDAKLFIDVSFGSVTLLLPGHWKVQERTDRSFSAVTTHGSPAADADQLLVVECDLSFGTLDLQWQ